MAEVAIEKLSALQLTSIEKILLGKQHGVVQWLRVGYVNLVEDPTTVSEEEMARLGFRTAYRIMHAAHEVRTGILEGFSIPVQRNLYLCSWCFTHRHLITIWEVSLPNCPACGQGAHFRVVKTSSTATAVDQNIFESLKAAVEVKVAIEFEDDLKEAERGNSQATAE